MRDVYIPSQAERDNAHASGDFFRVSGDSVFATLQGEGVTAGEPAVFLRLQNCNLHCGANENGWYCDAWYTWDRSTPEFWREQSNTTVSDVAELIKTSWYSSYPASKDPRLVITGGEPLLQQPRISELKQSLDTWEIEIETNGTLVPDEELADCQFNCSPKLASSGNSLRERFRPSALNAIANMPNSWFKFVISGEGDIDEVKGIVDQTDITCDRVLLMSEGTVPDELRRSDEYLTELAKGLGCLVTARNQIFWFGNKRAT